MSLVGSHFFPLGWDRPWPLKLVLGGASNLAYSLHPFFFLVIRVWKFNSDLLIKFPPVMRVLGVLGVVDGHIEVGVILFIMPVLRNSTGVIPS